IQKDAQAQHENRPDSDRGGISKFILCRCHLWHLYVIKNYFLMTFTVFVFPSAYPIFRRYSPDFHSPKWLCTPGFAMVFTILPEASVTVTDLRFLASEMLLTSVNGFGYTLTPSLPSTSDVERQTVSRVAVT